MGFTLVEVLVALTIISIALLAALRAAGQATRDVSEMRKRLLASWVAENRIALHQAQGDWLALGTQRGTETSANIEFTWREEVMATPNNAFRRLDVFVTIAAEEHHILANFTGFITHPPVTTP